MRIAMGREVPARKATQKAPEPAAKSADSPSTKKKPESQKGSVSGIPEIADSEDSGDADQDLVQIPEDDDIKAEKIEAENEAKAEKSPKTKSPTEEKPKKDKKRTRKSRKSK